MARRNQMDDFMVGGSRGPSANRPDPNAGRRPGDPYIIAQDSRPVGTEGLSQNEIQQFNDFLNVSGRGDKIRNRTNISGRDAAKLARMQFDQFRNLQRGGDYAPSLTPGMKVPGGTIARRPEARGGLGSFFGGGGFLGGFLGALGGNAPKTIQASGPSGRGRGLGSKNRLNLNTGQVSAARKPTLSDDQIFDSLIKRATTVADANIPVGGIMDNFIPAKPADFDELSDMPASPTVTTQPGGTIAGPETFAKPEANLTDVIKDLTPAEAQPASTVDTMTDFDRAMSDRLALQAAAQDAADASELQMIELLQRGRELADRDAKFDAAAALVADAVSDRQDRVAAADQNLGLVQKMISDQEDLFSERDLGDMSYMREIEKDIIEPALSSIGPMGISLDGYGQPIMDYMSPTEEAYMRMTDADDVGVYMDPSAQTSEQQLRPYDRGGVPGTGEGITMRPSDVLGIVSGMAPPSSYGTYREFNREGMPYVSRRALNTREDLGRMMDEMMNRRLGYAPNISQGI